jgi:MFS family permease
MSRLGGLRDGLLGMRNFRLLSVGQLTSTIGDYCYTVALPWLVLSAHGSAAQLGGVLACYGIPRAALITVGGSLADRFRPRTIMLCSDVARCLLTAAIAVFAAAHVTSLTALGPVAALLGAGAALFMPASYAILPALLTPGELQAGNAVYNAAVQGGTLLGPAIGGAIVSTAGPAPAFGIDAASFALSAVSLAMIKYVSPLTAAPRPAALAPERITIWALLARERVLQLILVVLVGANFAVTACFEVALPVLSHARFGPGGYGAIMACFGAASVAGTLTAARASGLSKPAVVSASVFLIAALAVASVPAARGLPGAAAAMFVFGLVAGFGNVIFVTLIQRWAPPAMLGRVMGVVMLGSLGSFPLATAVAGMLARDLGPSPVFVLSGTLLALAILAGLTQSRFRTFGAPNLSGGYNQPPRPPGAPGLLSARPASPVETPSLRSGPHGLPDPRRSSLAGARCGARPPFQPGPLARPQPSSLAGARCGARPGREVSPASGFRFTHETVPSQLSFSLRKAVPCAELTAVACCDRRDLRRVRPLIHQWRTG